jgi:tetratricopeptide (TPR) repeat protein
LTPNSDKAISLLKKAIRLNPIAPARYFNWLGVSYWLIGKSAEAFDAWKKSLNKDPDFIWTHVRLAAYYITTANEKEAQNSVAEILRIDPAFSLDYVTSTLPYKNQSILENLVELLRKAGLPEHSPKKY